MDKVKIIKKYRYYFEEKLKEVEKRSYLDMRPFQKEKSYEMLHKEWDINDDLYCFSLV